MFFQKTEAEVKLPNSFSEPSVALKPKVEKDSQRKLQTNISHVYRNRNYSRFCQSNPEIYKG